MTISRDIILDALDVCVRRLELKAKRDDLAHNRQMALIDYSQASSRITRLQSGVMLQDGTDVGSGGFFHSADSIGGKFERVLYQGMMPTLDEAANAGLSDKRKRRMMMAEAQASYEEGRTRELARMMSISENARAQMQQLDSEITEVEEQIRLTERRILDTGVIPYRFWSRATALKQAMTEDNPALTLYDAVIKIGVENA